jgi:dihydroneopterin aldolase
MNNDTTIRSVTPTLAYEGDTVRIFIRDCRVALSVGIYDSEKQATQPVIISVEMEAALPHHYQDKNEKKLDRVIDYERVYHFIQNDLPKLGHIHLLESAAEQIIDFCFRDPRVRKAQVRLEKTEIFSNAAGAGIDMTRTRPSGDGV